MAYLTITRIAGDPDRLADRYRRSATQMNEVGRDHGLILHAAARTDDGLMIVNLWPAKDGSEAAARDPRRLRAVESSGVDPDGFHRDHFQVESYEVFR